MLVHYASGRAEEKETNLSCSRSGTPPKTLGFSLFILRRFKGPSLFILESRRAVRVSKKKKHAYLTLCLEPAAKSDALMVLDLLHV